MRSPTVLLLGLAAATAPAQIVSPNGYAARPGNHIADWLFGSPSRLQQVHADVRGPARRITAMALRRGVKPSRYYRGSVARTVDFQLWMGEFDLSDPNRLSFDMAKNYDRGPTPVIARRKIAIPNWVKPPTTTPAPFDLRLALDRPYAYTGKRALVWEAVVWSTSDHGDYLVDSVAHNTYSTWPTAILGPSCTAKGQLRPMQLRADGRTYALLQLKRYVATLSYTLLRGVRSAPAVLLLGTSDPNLPIPGFCARALRTDARVVLPGRTDAQGTWQLREVSIPWKSAFAGLALHAQAAALDQTQKPLPVVATGGLRATVQKPPPVPYTRHLSINPAIRTSVRLVSHRAHVVRFDS